MTLLLVGLGPSPLLEDLTRRGERALRGADRVIVDTTAAAGGAERADAIAALLGVPAEVVGPLDATGILSDAVVAEPGGRSLAATDSFVAIGPEGGWTDDELALAPEHVDLGENVLRTETAVVVAAVLAAAARR